ncbi:MAG: DUF2238 domain-containing protein [Actinobacteria bacterium]|nr:DUF2238 domain-containing protein [Actinomycetota bacterium]
MRAIKPGPFDLFILVNFALLLMMTGIVYYAAEWEFGLYAAVFIGAGFLLWRVLRKYSYPMWLFLALEVGILAHFAGGLIHFGPHNTRLYGHYFIGLRFDKYVHLYNSLVGSVALRHLFRQVGLSLRRMESFIVIAVVLGIGALIEIVEYLAVTTMPSTGVGDYANNMQDLIFNLAGGSLGMLLVNRLARTRLIDAPGEDREAAGPSGSNEL